MITLIVVGVVSFIVGAVFGVTNQSSVSNAISVLKQAEKKAEAVLSEIADHKAT